MCVHHIGNLLFTHVSRYPPHCFSQQTVVAAREEIAAVEQRLEKLTVDKAGAHRDRVQIEKRLSTKAKELEKKV